MKKLSLVFGLALLCTVVLAGCNSTPTPTDTAQNADVNIKEVAGYPMYDATAASADIQAGKDVALFFNSKTCGSCAKLEADIVANADEIPADTVIYKVDWDDNQDLAKELSVAKYHTVVYPGNNNEQVTGLFTLDDLLQSFSTEANAADTNLKEVVGYPVYTAATLAAAENEGKDVALFFNSKTCGSCAKLEDDIVANADEIPANTEIFKVDWDDNQDLAKELGVAKYHTVVYPGNNNEQVTGLFTLDDLLQSFSTEANAADSDDTAVAPSNIELASYETYSEENYEAALAAGKTVVLNFRASRCPTCTKTSTDLINNQDEIPADVVILETDYDTYTDLKKEYGVIKQTSFAFINPDGTHDKTITDIRSMEDLLSNI